MSDFQIFIDGEDISLHIKEFKAISKRYGSASTFEATLDGEYNNINLVEKPAPYNIFLEGACVQSGYLDSYSVSSDKSKIEKKIKGRDALQLLMDNDCIFSTAYSGTIDKIFTELIQGLNVTNKNTSTRSNAYIDKVYLLHTDKNGNKNPLYYTLYKNNQALTGTGQQDVTQVPGKLIIGQNILTGPGKEDLLTTISLQYTTDAKQVLRYGKKNEFTFNNIKTTMGKTLFEYFTGLLNQVGLFIRAVPNPSHANNFYANKNIYEIFSYDHSTAAAPELQWEINNDIDYTSGNKNNILSVDYTENVKDFYQFVRLVGNTHEEELGASSGKGTSAVDVPSGNRRTSAVDIPSSGGTAKSVYSIDALALSSTPDLINGVGQFNFSQLPFKGLTKFKTTHSESVDLNAWLLHRDRLLSTAMIKQVLDLYRLKYVVSGFKEDPKERPYMINDTIFVTDKILNFIGIEMLITEIEYEGNKNSGFKTTLNLSILNPFDGSGLRKSSFTSYTKDKKSPGDISPFDQLFISPYQSTT